VVLFVTGELRGVGGLAVVLDAEAGKGGDGCENGVGIEREKRERRGQRVSRWRILMR